MKREASNTSRHSDDMLLNDLWEEDPEETEETSEKAWKFMIIDDEPEVHRVTKMVLNDFYFEGRPVEFISGYSGAEAKRLMASHPETAILLLDAVMEHEAAGIEVVQYVREQLNNHLVRIIFRTGQPGEVPEREVVHRYDINDYKEKTELTAEKLYTTMYSAIRSYRDLVFIDQHNQRLEHLVNERTADLQETNHQLKQSLQQTAEAFAEVAKLEERNRIAHDIHDVVGHALTTTVIQMEAGKRLIAFDPELAQQKLSLAQGLVRQGLQDIRQSVHMLKKEGDAVKLWPMIQKLIMDTELNAQVSVTYKQKAIPELDAPLKKTVYHALQQGLTNGIQHGGATRFWFDVDMQEDSLAFELRDNGKGSETQGFGFGLTALKERVEQQNGRLEFKSSEGKGATLWFAVPVL
ncbi:ATP-binding response regulator [Aureibacillus halotolerans]|uniref:histidine kinase n=1 Tax=Aureibacillus halotolerans TaxID=1508390 RepID=A0A4R6U5K7_9BACI|nr:histidine kinase [Aureibacillus halotolerans]TDQ40832.1 signal transduction histidine kinase [Aureibacillus halotolerans]